MFDWSDYEAAAQRYTNIFKRRDDTVRKAAKRKEPNMDRMTKNVKAMGEAEYVRIVTDFAKRLHPELSRERAFSKVFLADDDAGQAIRKMWQVSKGSGDRPLNAVDEPDEPDEDDEDDTDALAELEELARQERMRANGMLTKEAAFVKVYQANPKLAAKERRQNRPRA